MMNQQKVNLLGPTQFRNSPNMIEGIPQPIGGGLGAPANPPPLPPRRPTSSYQSYNPFGTSYAGNYGYGYGFNNTGMGRYGNLGSYPGPSLYGQNQWGPSGDVENRFIQYAEESTRPAFQSIETMVHTFSSLTIMLESTFFAMTSSFRAIVGAAENMSKLRIMFKQFMSSFALIRFLKWLYWKVKYIIGINKQDINNEALWSETIAEVFNENLKQPGPSSWPIFLFLTILFAFPYIIHKLVSNAKNMSINVNNPKEWLLSKEPIYTVTALYDFTPASSEELPLKIGQKLWIAPQSLQPKNLPGWWRATNSINVGLIPSTYVTVVGQLKKKSESNQTQVLNFHESSVINETSSSIKEESGSQEVSDCENDNDYNFSKSKIEHVFETKNKNN